MTAVIGHMVLFVAALVASISGLGLEDEFGGTPLMLVLMAVSAISVATLVRNVRGLPETG